MTWTPPLDDSDVLALLLEHFPGLLFVKDSQFRIVTANDRMLSLYPPEQRPHVIGTTTLESYPEEQQQIFLAADAKALAEGESENVETVDFPNGERRTFLTKKIGKNGNDGNRYLIAASTDITELEASRTEAAQLWELLNHSATEIYILDGASLVASRLSDGALRNLGLERGQEVGVSFAEWVDDAMWSRVQDAAASLAVDARMTVEVQGRHRRLDGSLYEVSSLVLGGELSGKSVVLVVAQDVTRSAKQQRTLQRQNEALNEFAYRVSHDLRSPVLSAIALVDVAQSMLADGNTEMAQGVLERTLRALNQAEALAGDLLELTRIDNQVPVAETVELGPLIAGCVEQVGDIHGDGDVDIRVNTGDIREIVTERKRLAWVVHNLLSNAIKYRDRSAAEPYVHVGVRRSGDHVVFEFDDNGMGIAERQRAKVFQMFQRFHPSLASGSGLGLYMVQQTARRLGGSASYAPTDEGSRFTVAISEEESTWS